MMKKQEGIKSSHHKIPWGSSVKELQNGIIDYSTVAARYADKSALLAMKKVYEIAAEGPVPSTSQPLVGCLCNLVPEELVRVCGGRPLRLCTEDGMCAKDGDEIIPGDVCPLIKAICGLARKDVFERLDLLVIPAACEGKSQISEILSPACQIYLLDLPRSNDYLKSANAWEKNLAEFYRFMRNRYNVKPSRRELMRECRSTNARTKVFRELYQVRSERPDILNSFDYFTLSYLSFFHPPESWLSLALPVLQETFRAAENSVFPGLRRVLLAGAPIIFPNYKLLEVLENAGCLIGADMLCSAYGRLYDPVEVDEDTERGIIRALALRYIGGSLCPCFVNSGKLNDAAINLVREYGLDGVVYHNLRLCQPYDIRLTMMRQATKKENIPFLSIKTDFGQEDIGQLKTRVEAFLEVLTAQNK